MASALGTTRDAAGYLMGMVLILVLIVVLVLVTRAPKAAIIAGMGIGFTTAVLLAWFPPFTVILAGLFILIYLVRPWDMGD